MLIQGLTDLPRGRVRRIIVSLDTVLILLAVCLSLSLNEFGFWTRESQSELFWMLAVMGPFGVASVIWFGLHRIKLVMFNAGDVFNIGAATTCIATGYFVVALMLGVPGVFTKTAIFYVAIFAGSIGSRVWTIMFLLYVRDRLQARERVAIFGAGSAGIQLASALRQGKEMRPVLFFDDSPHLDGMAIGGIPVWSSQKMLHKLGEIGVETVLIALPDSAHVRRAALIESLEKAKINVRVLPPFVDLLVERGNEALFRTVSPDEILNRDAVDLDTPEVAKSYAGRVVMVTGAGGSIGSELCRQLLNCRADCIVLFDQSEFNLYNIDRDLRARALNHKVDVRTYLGSVTDPVRVRQVIAEQKVDIILHAAAYKHVPIVEQNGLEGARNNVIGTKVVADAAIEAKIERFILVSTDKAVRPTNIMGATKRMAEMVIQDLQLQAPNTNFSMVRFGNVLGSSGSVLPLFQAQIESGGPVTVTHPEVSRFFMTISEAARLVLLAGAYAEGGDVFVLYMGKPQKIMAIAQRMIELSGRTVKTHSGGDIEIKVTGLRPGEKLYEELLLDHENLRATPNSKILRAEVSRLPRKDVIEMLKELNVAIKTANEVHLRKVVGARVEGYHLEADATEELKEAYL